MDATRRKLLYLGGLSGACAVMGWRIAARAGGTGDLPDPASYRKMADLIRPLFTAKKAPVDGDWLSQNDEPGQTFAQYAKTNPNRPTTVRRYLYLVELGTFDEEQRKTITLLREYMGLVFGLEVKTLPMIDTSVMPAAAQRINPQTKQLQFQSIHILDKVLQPRRPTDAVALLALTPVDLWPGKGWNFVFGQASLGERVGVWSTARFGDPAADKMKFLRRVLQVATHETGHMFGIKHCTAYECGMNGSNSLEESDLTPLPFCPECEAKLWWVCRQQAPQRATALAAFADRNGFGEEAKLWRAQAAAWSGSKTTTEEPPSKKPPEPQR